MQDCRQRFRAVLVEATFKLDELVKRIGRAVDDSKPYWEARKVARQVRWTGPRGGEVTREEGLSGNLVRRTLKGSVYICLKGAGSCDVYL